MFPFPAFHLPTGLTLAFVTSANAHSETASLNIDIPAEAKAGDFAFCFEYCVHVGGSFDGVPDGFTQIIGSRGTTGGTNYYDKQISYKKLEAGDAGAALSGGLSPSSYQNDKIILAFRPSVDAVVTITDQAYVGTGTNSAPADLANTASADTPPMIVIGSTWSRTNAGAGSGDPSFTTQTPAFGGVLPASPTMMQIGYTIYGKKDVPSDQTIGMADAGYINWLHLFTAEFVPA